jgi:peptide/nickel transport system ATP-binding protein
VKAVSGVDFSVRRGRTLGFVGESGSGKSSIAHAVIGLVEPTAGEITLLGVRLPKRLSRRDLQTLRTLQMVFQNPDEALNPYLTVGETLRRPFMKLRGLPRREADEAVAQILEWVRLDPGYMPRLPTRLSGGEKQRVAIARAFAARPDLVICDEPTSALDVSVQARILNLLVDLQREGESAYLFISHDLGVVSYLADEIAVLYLGQIAEMGKTEDVLAPPYHPYTEALLSSIPLPEPGAGPERIRLEGEVPSPTNLPTGCPFHTRCPRFLGEICVRELPPRRQARPGHQIVCHIPPEELEQLQKTLIAPGRELHEGEAG